jgi:Spy/CpxP family protein refolding chaperone
MALKTPGHRFMVMVTERAVDYFQFRQDLSLTDDQMISIRGILRNTRRALIQQDAFLKLEMDVLGRLLLNPVFEEQLLINQLELVEDLIKNETKTCLQGLEELQAVLNKEQILTYAFIKGVPLPVMEFPRGEYEGMARKVMDRHGEFFLKKKKELELLDMQVQKLSSLNQQYLWEMVSRSTLFESGQFEVQDLVSEPVINFEALRKQVLENEKLKSVFFSTMVSYLTQTQKVLTPQQVNGLVQVLN